ncbi:hypothetical protein [Rhizobium sp. 11_C7_N12_5]|uniref:hypothetical protein n=1 Tax=Rhizobium sp. 11_C7_N12_5 TaxID=3240770 RepID=UPI003F1EE788
MAYKIETFDHYSLYEWEGRGGTLVAFVLFDGRPVLVADGHRPERMGRHAAAHLFLEDNLRLNCNSGTNGKVDRSSSLQYDPITHVLVPYTRIWYFVDLEFQPYEQNERR